ncbi:MAG: PEP-CTERM sorting domain-containing protein [Opitutales bacterium]|nr:PEP-CTERM sorting domain-containing protein [Opitutales bacterium]
MRCRRRDYAYRRKLRFGECVGRRCPGKSDLGYTYGNVAGGWGITFIPEPSAFGLLAGLGALTLVASRRRRK